MTSAPIILVPGFWLGAWAWDEVAAQLRADGHDVTALTLPGLESTDADRSKITFSDHVDAIIEALEAAGRPSSSPSTARPGSAATRRATGSRSGSPRWSTSIQRPASRAGPGLRRTREAARWADVSAEENLDGLTEEQLATFRERAVPVPGGVLREELEFTNDARRDIPSTIIATGSHRRRLPEVRGRASRMVVPGRRPGAARRHLDRPADQPLADVVEAAGARRDHRGRRDEAGGD